MFYQNMPDVWTHNEYSVFYYEGEFVLQDNQWNTKGLPSSEEFKYFEDTEECLFAMKDIAPWCDWKISDFAH